MATVHDEIDNWLAADLYGELSNEEQRQLHTHLVDCAACRKTHQETKTMNKILEETLAQQKPDPTFEQRMLAGFRNRVPERTGLLKLLADLMRMRAAQDHRGRCGVARTCATRPHDHWGNRNSAARS